MTAPLTWVPVRNLGVYSRRSGPRKIIETYNDAYTLSDVGAFIWSRVGTGATMRDVIDAVTTRYDIADAQATADVQAFLADMISLGFIEPFGGVPEDAQRTDPRRRLLALVNNLAPRAACAFVCDVNAQHLDANALVIVTDDPPTDAVGVTTEESMTGRIYRYESVDEDAQGWKIQLWRPQQIESLIVQFAKKIPSQEDKQPESADESVLRQLTKSVAVVGNELVEHYRLGVFNGGYALWYAENHKYIAENSLEDVAGMISARDFESAAMSVYSAFNLALDARLALDWDLSPVREEFAARVAAASVSPRERKDIMAVLLWSSYENDPEKWVKTAARTAERMLIAVEQRWFA